MYGFRSRKVVTSISWANSQSFGTPSSLSWENVTTKSQRCTWSTTVSCLLAVNYFYNLNCVFLKLWYPQSGGAWNSILVAMEHCLDFWTLEFMLWCKLMKLYVISRFSFEFQRYAYYMLAAIGPQMQKYLWWKKYLTGMQMVQFTMVFVHSIQLFFYNPCGYPLVYCYALIGHAIMFFFLFKGKIRLNAVTD